MADNAAAANGKGGTIGGKVDMISSKFDPVYNLLNIYNRYKEIKFGQK